MRTSVKDIYAAGDVAEAHNFFTGEQGMSPILPSAVAQGEVAGANMAGEDTEYQGWISRNVFNFFGQMAFSVGLSMPLTGTYHAMKQTDDEKKQFKKVIYAGDTLVGCTFLNTDVDPGIMQYLIAKRVHIGSHKEAFFERPKEISRWLMLEAERRQAFLSET
jgi:NADPH-dependent 2,4-dienoyl-CoA reductase/sulfur reductase-like enzyme